MSNYLGYLGLIKKLISILLKTSICKKTYFCCYPLTLKHHSARHQMDEFEEGHLPIRQRKIGNTIKV